MLRRYGQEEAEINGTRETAGYEKENYGGLTAQEAAKRLQREGYNRMREKPPHSPIKVFMKQLADPLIYILAVAAAVSMVMGEISDAVIILVVVLVNATVGMVQEGKAEKALEALKQMTSPQAVVVRDGRQQVIPAAELVTGDLVCLEAGDRVPADLRLIETVHMKVEESALTGESLPVEKNAWGSGQVGEKEHLAFMSTYVTGGRGKGIVKATGMHTELGKIASLIEESGGEQTPLQKRMGELGTLLSILSVGLCVALFIIAVMQKRDVWEMLLTAISLAVAAVPEGLPAVVTVTMALSVAKMVKVNTIIRRLPSVETLGAVTVVCSDKTGTLTENRMTVVRALTMDDEWMKEQGPVKGTENRIRSVAGKELLRGMILCNDARLEGESHIGDPTELALLQFGADCGEEPSGVRRQYIREGEYPFDSDCKMMTTFHGHGYAYTKGAPDEVLKRCNTIMDEQGKELPLTQQCRNRILQQTESLSGEALRTLALARKRVSPGEVGAALSERSTHERNLTWIGMVGMEDPVRREAAEAVSVFKQAGVHTVMITGDHVETAYAVGKKLGIVENREQCMTGKEMEKAEPGALHRRMGFTRVFARVTPSQKVDIVKGLKAHGEIVAMMGDGVNDAPSLKAADIGIAMGKGGTDVAKQASDMILTDDNFATVEKAIAEGRGIYENIRKTVIFLLSSNLGEVLTMFTAVVLGLASPLKSAHILWINLITDSLPALALSMDKSEGEDRMQCPPRRPEESLFARGGLMCTCFYGALITVIGLVAFVFLPVKILRDMGLQITPDNINWCLGNEDILQRARTYAFTVLGMCQLFHAWGMRDTGRSIFRNSLLSNKLMIFAMVAGFGMQFLVTEIPFFVRVFGTAPLSAGEWGMLTVLAAFPLLAHELMLLPVRSKK